MTRRHPHLTKVLGLVAGIVLIAAACSDDSVSSDDLRDALVEANLFTEEEAQCVVDEIGDSVGGLDAGAFTGDDLSDEDQAAITDATVTCLTGSDSEEIPDPSDTDLNTEDPPPGDDAELDALWVGCAGGDGQACDDLFFQSDTGSVYEEFGNTCGAREFAISCADSLSG